MTRQSENNHIIRNSRNILLVIGIFFSLTTSLSGRTPIVNFQHLTPKDGLSQNHINSIIQDSRGFLWLATFNGLNRYDGYNIKKYYNEINNPNSLSHQSVNVVYEDGNGIIWAGTENGLNKLNTSTNSFTRYYYEDSVSLTRNKNDIRTIYQDDEGYLWIGFYGNGLKKFNPETGQFKDTHLFVGENETDSIKFINAFYADQESNFWIGTERNGLLKLNEDRTTIKQYSSNSDAYAILSDSCIATITEDDSNNLWIGTWGGGLNVLNKNTDSVTIYKTDTPKSISNNLITSIVIDEPYIWIGTFGGGLNRYDRSSDSISVFKHDPADKSSLSNNTVWCLHKDHSSILWIGTYGGSVNKYVTENNPTESYQSGGSEENELNENQILSFLESSDGLIYIGTNGGGINVFDRENKSFSYLLNDSDLGNGTIRCLFEDNNRELWVGTDAGVYRFNQTRKSRQFYPLSTKEGTLGPNSIYSIAQDKDGNMWFGSWRNGLKKIRASELNKNPGQVTFISFDNEEFANNTIWDIFEDSRGDLWIGAIKSLYRYNFSNKTFNKFTPNETNSQNLKTHNFSVSCFLENEQQKTIWFGTLGNGIGEFDLKSGKFRFLSSKENTGRDEVFSIYADKNWNIWMGSNLGLAKYDVKLNEFQEISLNQSKKNEIIDRIYQLDSNELLLGGNIGFYIFNPADYAEKPIMPQIALTDFKIYNTSLNNLDIDKFGLDFKSINSKKEITLNHKINVFSIEFASLDFREPQKIKYQYMMEGFDDNWISTTAKNRLATYTNLNSGDYTFKVMATNSDGIWSNDIKTLFIFIKAPWYKSKTARIIAPLLILLILLLLFLYNQKRIKDSIKAKEVGRINNQLIQEQKRIEEYNKRLSERLNKNDKDLAANKLLVHEKNETMAALRKELLALLNHASSIQKPLISTILTQLDMELKEMDGWDSLKENLDILQNDFLKRLAEDYPRLTQKDLKICSLIVTGKTNKEIAKIINISVHSVEMSRYRIRKKLNLKRPESLNEFLLRF
jgi:ligand-binding sensor domain-containing protein/DNA-binding CsgD family transcriptional regulator